MTRVVIVLLALLAGCSESEDHKAVRIWREQLAIPVGADRGFMQLTLCLHAPPGAPQADRERCRAEIAPKVVALNKSELEAKPEGDIDVPCRRLFQAVPLVDGLKPYLGEHCCAKSHGPASECEAIGHPFPASK